jgi:PAS domain S-box-containing protein
VRERKTENVQEAPIGIVLTSRDGKFITANPAFCRMLGYTVEEITRMTFLDVTHPDDRSTNSHNVEAMWQGKIPSYRTEKRYIARNGDTRWGGLSTSLIRDGDGRPLYAMAMVEDITERRHAEELLKLGEERYKLMLVSASCHHPRGTEITYASPLQDVDSDLDETVRTRRAIPPVSSSDPGAPTPGSRPPGAGQLRSRMRSEGRDKIPSPHAPDENHVCRRPRDGGIRDGHDRAQAGRRRIARE